VREALKRLAAEGIVQHDLHRGFFIANLSREDAWQLFRLRHLLEHEVLSSSRWPVKSELAALAIDVGQLAELLRSGQRADWSACQREFLRKVFELSPHRILVREALRLRALTDRYRPWAPTALADAGGPPTERAILKVLAARDRPRLRKLFAEECRRSERELIGNLSARGL
jgi:DNA-binding GntR family transcriptional regulator